MTTATTVEVARTIALWGWPLSAIALEMRRLTGRQAFQVASHAHGARYSGEIADHRRAWRGQATAILLVYSQGAALGALGLIPLPDAGTVLSATLAGLLLWYALLALTGAGVTHPATTPPGLLAFAVALAVPQLAGLLAPYPPVHALVAAALHHAQALVADVLLRRDP